MMNSVHDVVAEKPFDILVSNSSARYIPIPKGMIICYASRSPLEIISLDGSGAQEMCGIINIFPTSDAGVTVK